MLELLRNFAIGILLALSKLLPGFSPVTGGLVVGLLDEWLVFLKNVTDAAKYRILMCFNRTAAEQYRDSLQKIDTRLWIPILVGIVITVFALQYTSFTIMPFVPKQIVLGIAFGAILAAGFIPYEETGTLRKWYYPVITILTLASCIPLFTTTSFITPHDTSAITYALSGLLTPFVFILPGMNGAFFLQRFGVLTMTGTILVVWGTKLFAVFMIFIGAILIFQVVQPFLMRFRGIFLAIYTGITWATLSLVWPFYNLKTGVALLPWQVRLPVFTQILLAISVSFAIVSLIRVVLALSPRFGKSFGDPKRIKTIAPENEAPSLVRAATT